MHKRKKLHWLTLLVSLYLLVVVAAIVATRADAIQASHPAYEVILIAVALLAAIALILSLFRFNGSASRRKERLLQRSAPLETNLSTSKKTIRIISQVALTCLVLAIGYALIWLQPLAATQPSLSALHSDSRVTVTVSIDEIDFLPITHARTGVIFYPGALVDPRAYSFYMHALAQQGFATFIVKMPLNIAFLGMDRAENIIVSHPAITSWAIAGHSLGGVSASAFAASHKEIQGLLLYASYPANDISSQLDGKLIVSLYGSNDGLATPEKIAQSKKLLPSTTQFIVIQGSIHGFFGDYGQQTGDGQPTISRTSAQQQILAASLHFLQQLDTQGSR